MKHLFLTSLVSTHCALQGVSEAKVSVGRIQKFLETPELSSPQVPLIGNVNKGAAIVVSQATCHWNNNGSANVSIVSAEQSSSASSGDIANVVFDSTGLVVALDNVNLDFCMGTLTCIIGNVGSGKSAIVQMLAGELPLSSGQVQRRVDSTLAYAPQSPFIAQGSVRDNILFGHDYDETNYQRILVSCGLDVDFAQLRGGEDTMVGDRGAQLSGGQRAR